MAEASIKHRLYYTAILPHSNVCIGMRCFLVGGCRGLRLRGGARARQITFVYWTMAFP
jgi:hypothetical protein